MNTKNLCSFFPLAVLLLSIAVPVPAQTTAFSYQGRLSDGSSPANGIYDLRFTIFDALTSGSVGGGPITNAMTGVSNGLFATELDFGASVFNGADRWLEIAVRTNGNGSFAALAPRQKILPTPYAIHSTTADALNGTLALAQLPPEVLTNGGNIIGTFFGNGGGVTNLNAAQLTGSLPSATLPTNVALLNASQAFTGTNIFSRNVGIGTNNPATLLHAVSTSGDAELSIQSGDGGGHRWTIQSSGTNSAPVARSFQIIDRTRSASRFLIDTNGNIGIGTTTPTNLLTVNGAVSGMTFNGNTFNGATFRGGFAGSGIGLTEVPASSLVNITNSVVAWGSNTSGQATIPAAALHNVSALAAGGFHSLALKPNGTVIAWGHNDFGQATVPAGLSNVIAIAAGQYHSLALKSDGTVVGWGRNNMNQLNIPAGLSNVVAIAAGFASIALKNDGTAVTWGNWPAPADLSNVISVAAGADFFLALKSDGLVTAWGGNFSGQTNVPPGLSNVVSIAALGYTTAMALKSDGTVVVWGYTGSGQTNFPPGLTNVIAIAGAGDAGVALKGNGTVAVWGLNRGGQLNVPDGLSNVTALGSGSVNQHVLVLRSETPGPVVLNGIFSGNGAGLSNVPGAIPLQIASGTNVLAQANTAYDATNSAETIFTLPTGANVGDLVRVHGLGGGGWRVDAGGQIINGYQSWVARESARAWSSIASSADGNKLVAVDHYGVNTGNGLPGGQIYTSTDGGASWTARATNRYWNAVASSANGFRLVATVGGGQIYTSADGGVSWTARDSNRGWGKVASSADGNRLVAVVNGGQIYTSTDSGVNWTARENNRAWTSIASSTDGMKLVATTDEPQFCLPFFPCFPGGGQIYTSIDGGTNWTARAGVLHWRSVASSADGTKLVAVDSGGRIHTSTDSGVTWTPRENDRAWSAVASSADGTKLVAAVSYGQLYVSGNSGISWTAQDSPRAWSSVASSADGTKLAATVDNGNIYTLADVPLVGGQGSSVELQYAGNGVWQPVNFPQSSINGPNTVVVRDAGGNFSASIITASSLVANGMVSANTFSGGTFSGNGSGLTGLDAAQLSTGTVPLARLPAGLLTNNASGVTLSGNFSGDFNGGTVAATTVTSSGSNSASGFLWGSGGWLRDDQGGAAELGNSLSPGVVPYIDFHYGTGIAQDYNVRLINNVSNQLTLFGNLQVNGNISGNGSGLTLSTNVALLNTNQTFSGQNNFLSNVGIGTNSPATRLHVVASGDAEISVQSTDAGNHRWTIQSSGSGTPGLNGSLQIIDRTAGASRLLIGTNGNIGIGVTDPTNKLHVAGGITCTALTQTSDRNAKENFAPVSPAEVLAKVAALPISRWNFKAMKDGAHMGPMAQDFYAAFGLGGGETTITAIDADGVALAAIQGLNQKFETQLKEKDTEIGALKSQNDSLAQKLLELEAAVKSILERKQP